MWPAALGGQYSYWDDGLKAYVIGEGSGKNAAIVGSPLGLTPPEQPAHNLPDAPSQFAIRITPEMAAQGLVPIVDRRQRREAGWREEDLRGAAGVGRGARTASRPRTTGALREEMTSIETPDARIDLAFEWGKVALDKGFVCNPHLGCGLIAGLGPSGTTERPGFGWFFGGDTFINAWAISAYGDLDTIRQSLEFLRKRQRADGKMMHELSQGAGYIRWFEDYPYGYYHADTTPLYIIAVRDYVRASGDAAFAKDFWPSMRKAYDYCASTDEDGDGLMDNTKAGLGRRDRQAAQPRRPDRRLPRHGLDRGGRRDARPREGGRAAVRRHGRGGRREGARVAQPRGSWTTANRRINFAIMKDGTGQAEQTVWPAFGIWRGVFDAGHAGGRRHARRAGAARASATDWGARMLSNDSTLYEPLSYNNGASWPFLSGLGRVRAVQGRPRARPRGSTSTRSPTSRSSRAAATCRSCSRATALRSMDAAVPHQLFATTGFASALMRGMVGLEETDRGLRLAPQLPPGWDFLRLRNLRWRDAAADVEIRREAERRGRRR